MLTVSKALSSGQAQKYHKLEFTSKSQSYYGQGNEVKGEWQGKLVSLAWTQGERCSLGVLAARGGLSPTDRGADGEASRRNGLQEPGWHDDQIC